MIKDYLSTGRGYMSNIPSVVSNKYQLIIGILLVCGIFSGYYAVSYIIYVVKERSKHYKYKKLMVYLLVIYMLVPLLMPKLLQVQQ